MIICVYCSINRYQNIIQLKANIQLWTYNSVISVSSSNFTVSATALKHFIFELLKLKLFGLPYNPRLSKLSTSAACCITDKVRYLSG